MISKDIKAAKIIKEEREKELAALNVAKAKAESEFNDRIDRINSLYIRWFNSLNDQILADGRSRIIVKKTDSLLPMIEIEEEDSKMTYNKRFNVTICPLPCGFGFSVTKQREYDLAYFYSKNMSFVSLGTGGEEFIEQVIRNEMSVYV